MEELKSTISDFRLCPTYSDRHSWTNSVDPDIDAAERGVQSGLYYLFVIKQILNTPAGRKMQFFGQFYDK